jgi:hypothetical protein
MRFFGAVVDSSDACLRSVISAFAATSWSFFTDRANARSAGQDVPPR